MTQLPKEVNELTEQIIGAAIDVHRILGPGYQEQIYEEALVLELGLREVPCRRQVPIEITYKGASIGERRLDLIVAEQVIVELKAVEAIIPVHCAQVVSYLKATGLRIGLLINFNVLRLREGVKRLIY